MVEKRKGRGYLSTEELIDQTIIDPANIDRWNEVERHMQESQRNYQKAAKGVLSELAAAGFDVHSVGELVDQFARSKVPYTAAVPILMKWLPLVEYDALKEDIIRTLSVPWAKPEATSLMLEEYDRVPGETDTPRSPLRWAVGNALYVLADDSIFDDIVRIATNRRYGTDRSMVVRALGKMKNPRSIDILIGLLDDEEAVAGPAVEALGKLKARKALPHLERFLQHPKSWIRKEARKSIKKIESRR